MQTVQENKEGFTHREITDAEKSRSAYNMVGGPSAEDLDCMVCDSMFKNCLISVTDKKNTHTIFGPDIVFLRGKKVRKKRKQ